MLCCTAYFLPYTILCYTWILYCTAYFLPYTIHLMLCCTSYILPYTSYVMLYVIFLTLYYTVLHLNTILCYTLYCTVAYIETYLILYCATAHRGTHLGMIYLIVYSILSDAARYISYLILYCSIHRDIQMQPPRNKRASIRKGGDGFPAIPVSRTRSCVTWRGQIPTNAYALKRKSRDALHTQLKRGLPYGKRDLL